MSIASELENYKTFLAAAYAAAQEKGATMPSQKNLNNLASTIASISGGGGGDTPVVPEGFTIYNWIECGSMVQTLPITDVLGATEFDYIKFKVRIFKDSVRWSISETPVSIFSLASYNGTAGTDSFRVCLQSGDTENSVKLLFNCYLWGSWTDAISGSNFVFEYNDSGYVDIEIEMHISGRAFRVNGETFYSWSAPFGGLDDSTRLTLFRGANEYNGAIPVRFSRVLVKTHIDSLSQVAIDSATTLADVYPVLDETSPFYVVSCLYDTVKQAVVEDSDKINLIAYN